MYLKYIDLTERPRKKKGLSNKICKLYVCIHSIHILDSKHCKELLVFQWRVLLFLFFFFLKFVWSVIGNKSNLECLRFFNFGIQVLKKKKNQPNTVKNRYRKRYRYRWVVHAYLSGNMYKNQRFTKYNYSNWFS